MSNHNPFSTLYDFTSLNHERYQWLNQLFAQIRQEVTLAKANPSTQEWRLNTIATLADIAELLTQQYQDELLGQKQDASQEYEQIRRTGLQTPPAT